MSRIDTNVMKLIKSSSDLADICQEFKDKPTQTGAMRISEVFDNCNKNLLKVKDEIVIMLKDMDEEEDFSVEAIKTSNGYLIK